MVPDAGGDFVAAIVAMLGIVILTVSVIMAGSVDETRRTRSRLVTASGVPLATVLLMWAVARAAEFVTL